MAGLTRRCQVGDVIQIGNARLQIVKSGRRVTVNIVAPEDIPIVCHSHANRDFDNELNGQLPLSQPNTVETNSPHPSVM